MSDKYLHWKRIEPTIVSKIGWRTIVSKTYKLPNGEVHHFETINSDDWQSAAVLALTEDNKVIVARQFRPGPGKIMYELPGGVVEDNEEKELGIKREFLEETGYEAASMTHMGVMHYEAYTNGKRHCFFATGCKLIQRSKLGEHEFIEMQLITIDQLIENARSGDMTDPGAVLLAYDELMKIKEGTDEV